MMKLVVLSCVLAAASASVVGVAPLTYGASLAYGAPLAYGTSLAYGAPLAYSTPLLASSNYRGPLSLAPGQPANILGSDGRPLDTLDVNLDRSAHIVAKALDSGVHLLKKRSVAPLIAPVAARVAVAPAPLIAPVSSLAYSRIAPVAHISPYSYASPYAAPYATYW